MTYIVKRRIKEDGKFYEPGDAYNGAKGKEFLKRGIVENEKVAKQSIKQEEKKQEEKK